MSCVPAGTPAGLRSKPSGYPKDPGTTTEDRPRRSGPGATGCVFSLLFCYHAGQRQRYRPGVTGSSAAGPAGRALLPAQTETLDERAVPVDVLVAQVGQQPPAAAHQQQQAAAAVVVVLVRPQVLVQVVDPASHERDLDLRRTGVTLIGRILREDLLLDFGVERHVAP